MAVVFTIAGIGVHLRRNSQLEPILEFPLPKILRESELAIRLDKTLGRFTKH
jgi:hypothetical protein